MRDGLLSVVAVMAAVCVVLPTGTRAQCPSACSCTGNATAGFAITACAFSNGLITLDLSSRKILSVPPGIFDSLTKLTLLDLSFNNLTSLPPGIFDRLGSLKTLQLRYNRLSSLPAGVLDGLGSLQFLGLGSNNLTTLPDGLFDKSSSLQMLYLDSNRLSSLPSLAKLSNLLYIDMTSNRVASLSAGMFDNLVSLTYMSFQRNLLTTLPPRIFDSLKNLTDLDLEYNYFRALPSTLFSKTILVPSGLDLWGNPGSKGDLCANASSHCVSPTCATCFCADNFTGPACATPCAPGSYGPDCLCACQNGAVCDLYTGTCLCAPGWSGVKCDTACAANTYGSNCSQTCSCQNGAVCNRFTGCNCTAGWMGASCATPCLSGTYGVGCSQACVCQNGASCDRFNGSCTCTAGWKGAVCDVPCPDGTYGSGCVLTCTCNNGGKCNAVTGICKCAAGWMGPSCDDACPNGQYGTNCAYSCVCKNGGTCDRVTGACVCGDQWDGSACEVPKVPPRPNAVVLSMSSRVIELRLFGANDTAARGLLYEIERIGCPLVETVMMNGTSLATGIFNDSRSLQRNQRYAYSIRAYNLNDPTFHTVSPAITLPFVTASGVDRPDRPSSLIAVPTLDTVNGVSAVRLSWVSDDSSGPILSTRILRSDNVSVLISQDGSYVDVNVQPKWTYTYTVWSRNPYGESDPSLNVTVVTLDITTFGNTAPYVTTSTTSAGAIAGAVVASIVGAVAVVLGVLYVRRRKRMAEKEAIARSELALIDTVVRRPEIVDLEVASDRVRTHARIGEGEFGEVFRGEMEDMTGARKAVALKTFKVSPLAPVDALRSARSAFMAEIDLMRTVPAHQNVVKLLGVVTQSEPNCMILEFAAHGDLKGYLGKSSEKELGAADLLCFALDVARGMEHLTKCQIVHRDLAARNCMVFAGPRPPNKEEARWSLSPKGQVIIKVADFGLSRDTSAGDYYNAKTRRMLPVKWMAPESLEKRVFTHASDVWSFGVVLWECFSWGAKPYPGVENHAVLEYLRENNRMACPPMCPQNAYALMEMCWRRLPETRPQFSQIVLQLRRILSGGERTLSVSSGQEEAEAVAGAVAAAAESSIASPYIETIPESVASVSYMN